MTSPRPNPLKRPASRPFDLYRKAEALRQKWVDAFVAACKRNGIDPKARFVVLPPEDERRVSVANSAYLKAREQWLRCTGHVPQPAAT